MTPLEALKLILKHVEDSDVDRVGSQCTLCHTYRMIGHEAIAKAEGRPADAPAAPESQETALHKKALRQCERAQDLKDDR